MGLKEKRLVESVLFSANTPLSIQDISEATGLVSKKVKTSLEALIKEYSVTRKHDTSMEIVKAGNKYVMQLKKRFIDPSISVAKADIQSHLLKTLALIAFHQPVKQSNLRRLAGPKIYDHVDDLVSMKLVHSQKHGSTELLTTTKKFPEYFGIESTKPEDIREFLINKVVEKVSSCSEREETQEIDTDTPL